jgi:hypothetical protein
MAEREHDPKTEKEDHLKNLSAATPRRVLVGFGIFIGVGVALSVSGFVVSVLNRDLVSIGYAIGIVCSASAAVVLLYMVEQRRKLIFEGRRLSNVILALGEHDERSERWSPSDFNVRLPDGTSVSPEEILGLLERAEAYDAYLQLQDALLRVH